MKNEKPKRFKKVAVLKGGPSAEREVSLRSGAAVANGLREAGYDVVEIDVTDFSLNLPRGIEAVFIALHGAFGEDGRLQRLLDAQGVPYTGSGADASEAAFDKRLSKKVFVGAGVPTAGYELVRKGGRRRMPLPVVVKPSCQGSSIGVHMVFSENEWEAAVSDALTYGDEALVEEYIEGREVTVGIVGDKVLPAVEIVTPGDWYSYRSKYNSGGATRYLVPAPLSEETARGCADAAWETFQALGCRGFGRVDIRLSTDGKVNVLEMNTIPGFTETSLLPKAAKQAGMSFPALCAGIMEMATCDGH